MWHERELFVNLSKKFKKLDEKDRLPLLAELIPWEEFRRPIKKAFRNRGPAESGRKPYDHVVMFKVLVLSSLYGLSDEQTEFQIRDRFSFLRFLGFGLNDEVPDARTIWLYREALTKAGIMKKLFERFNGYLEAQGFRAREGSLIDASIVEVPRQAITEEERKSLETGELPPKWQGNSARVRQKDTDAKWAMKYGESYFGYKNHINADRKYKLIRAYAVTNAAKHDSQVFSELVNNRNTGKKVWGDSAYDTQNVATILNQRGLTSRIQKQARGVGVLTRRQEFYNRLRSRIRKRVEHVFGFQVNSMKAKKIRSIGILRAKTRIGLNNLVYNFNRFLFLANASA